MVKRSKFVAALVVFGSVSAGVPAQTTSTPEGFSFKGNPLGMTLEQFKVSNPTIPCFTYSQSEEPPDYQQALFADEGIADGTLRNLIGLKINVRKAKGREAKAAAIIAYKAGVYGAKKAQTDLKALQDQGPLPDNVPWMVVISRKTNEISCSSSASMVVSQLSSLGDANPNGLTIGSTSANGVAYQFLGGKLYKVNIMCWSEVFTNLKEAFATKYGQPNATSTEDFQNAYGARWDGATFAWTKGSQAIALREGSGNGPAQDSKNSSSVTYEDYSLEPVAVKVLTNF
jgi:hypothetical protein